MMKMEAILTKQSNSQTLTEQNTIAIKRQQISKSKISTVKQIEQNDLQITIAESPIKETKTQLLINKTSLQVSFPIISINQLLPSLQITSLIEMSTHPIISIANNPLSVQSIIRHSSQQSQFQPCDISQFKARYVFKPFEYDQRLQQTLMYQIDAFNVKVPQNFTTENGLPQQHSHHNSINIDQPHSARSSNVKFSFGFGSNGQSFNSTYKSIKNNKTILYPEKPEEKTPQLPNNKTSLPRPPNLFKKTISFTTANSQFIPQTQTTAMFQSEHKPNRSFKKTSINKKRYEQQQKTQGLFYYDKNNFSSFKGSQNDLKNGQTSLKNNLSTIPQHQGSLCQSIALGSQMIQNFIKNHFQSSQQPFSHFHSNTSHNTITKNSSTSLTPQPLSFYKFCMLLFPQTPKSLPCSVLIMDTLFYINSAQTKEIIYVFKDKRRNLLMKMKNKNKSAYELFMKRRAQYEMTKAREEKLRKTVWYGGRQKWLMKGTKENWTSSKKSKWKNTKKSSRHKQVKFHTIQSFSYTNSITSHSKVNNIPKTKQYQSSVKCLQDSNYEESYKNTNHRYSIVEEDELVESTKGNNNNKETKRVVDVVENNSDEEGGLQNLVEKSEHPEGMVKNKNRESEQSEDLSYMSYHSGATEEVNKTRKSKKSFQSTYKGLVIEGLPNKMISPNKNEPSQQSRQQPVSKRPSYQTPQPTSPSPQHLSFTTSPRLTPSNSIRSSIHTLQTNYLAILKYLNNQTIRLKQEEFKAIFHNPLYANQRFKNNNNTQYIQALPIEDEFRDLKVYSMHFHYDIFKEQPLFTYVRETLYKENQYMALNNMGTKSNVYEDSTYQQSMYSSINPHPHPKTPLFDPRSPQSIKNLSLKQKLKQQSIQVYLYYQIFEMYTYVSMHYNKQILNGIFRFIEYDNEYALFETQNVVARNLPIEGEFIKAKIFAQKEGGEDASMDELLATLKLKVKQHSTPMTSTCSTNQTLTTAHLSATQTPSQTMKKINKQMLKLTIEDYGNDIEQTQLQKQLIQYFSEQNMKIEEEMSSYFHDKIEKIKNVKDSHLSKNIFRIINGLPVGEEVGQVNGNQTISGNNHKQPLFSVTKQKQQSTTQATNPPFTTTTTQNLTSLFDNTDFHSILNDEKKLQKFLKQKQQNDPYARKNISNYSVVRWKQEVKKVKQRKERKSHKGGNEGNVKGQCDKDDKNEDDVRGNNKLVRPMTEGSVNKSHYKQDKNKFTKLNTTDNHFIIKPTTNTFSSSSKQNLTTFFHPTKSNFLSTTNPFQRLNHSLNSKLNYTSGNPLNEKEVRRFSKKLINQKYTQVNKAKFTFNSFKTDKFF